MMNLRGRHCVRLAIALLLVGAFTTDCTWLRNTRNTPRQHWWEFWKPKSPDIFYPPDVQGTPPAPLAADMPGVGEAVVPLPEGALPPAPIGDAMGLPEARKTRLEPAGSISELHTVYFDYDSSRLTDAARQALEGNAAFLQANAGLRVLIGGHCDERGTQEYNLSLGQRRADAVREYLVSRGVAPDRLEVISYGEERPVAPGHNEQAWAQNRRAEFQIYPQ